MLSKKVIQDNTSSGKNTSFLWTGHKCLSIKLKAVTTNSVTRVEGFLFHESNHLHYSTLWCPPRPHGELVTCITPSPNPEPLAPGGTPWEGCYPKGRRTAGGPSRTHCMDTCSLCSQGPQPTPTLTTADRATICPQGWCYHCCETFSQGLRSLLCPLFGIRKPRP